MIPSILPSRWIACLGVGVSLTVVAAVTQALPPVGSGKTEPPAATIPAEFADPETGARIIHLSTVPNPASGVIYFTQSCVTPDSRYALVRYLEPSAGHTAGRMYRYDFSKGELIQLADTITRNQVLAAKSGNLYYTTADERSIFVTNILDRKTRKVADLPAGIACSNLTVNSDETLLAGTGSAVKPTTDEPVSTLPPNQGPAFNKTFEQHGTALLLSVEIGTGKVTELHRINTWLGHAQYSPTDPRLLMFCHEGPWEKVDRIWTFRLGSDAQPQLVLKRTAPEEIAGHEFWSADGATIWYDHAFRDRSGRHFLEGKTVVSGQLTRYPIVPAFGSIHYVQSPDGCFFVGDGGANKDRPDQQGMFILVPKDGSLYAVKLCSMAKNDYKAAEPNPHLTPDQHWVLFTATLFGTPQAYAVEMPKEFWR